MTTHPISTAIRLAVGLASLSIVVSAAVACTSRGAGNALTVGSQPQGRPATVAPPGPSNVTKAPPLVPGERIAVADPADARARHGYVDWENAFPSAGRRPVNPAPVYPDATSGTVIAFYSPVAGWLTVEQVASPAFDIAALERQAQAARRAAVPEAFDPEAAPTPPGPPGAATR
jgi:hypothetical protein